LEKNLTEHRANERILRYKLKFYQKNFLGFVYGNLRSIEAWDRDEEVEARPNRIAQEEEV
jgi:hypothetical protein